MNRATRGAKAHRYGLYAETMSVWFLRCKGYRILMRRYKTPVGEIDIVASKNGTLVFVEVKARGDLERAAGAMNPKTLLRMRRAADYFLTTGASRDFTGLRLDIILITPDKVWPRHYRGGANELGG